MMTDKENEKKTLEEQVRGVSQVYEELQDLTFELEVEHCTVLQDVDILDNQLHKYQTLLKSEEEDNKQFKNQIVKLQKQKKCFEEVISYFREEMALMADQLQNLQELLTLSHASMHEENNKLQKTCVDVKSINEELSSQLKAAEQKLLLENQMNQLNESKICELEKLISDKELDLGRHDRAILNIRQTLQCSLKQNEDLHMTIVSLNNTISKLQGAIKKYEQDNAKSKQYSSTCQEQIDSCKTKLEELKVSLEKKTTEICMLEMAYNSQNRTLKSAQMELKEMKEKQKEKQCHVKCILGELEEKLKLSEQKYNKLMEEYKKLETQLGIMNRRETIKEVEIQRFRQIIAELKKTLIDLNKKLTKQEFKAKCQNEACGKSNDQDATPACPCEVEFCQNIAEYVKISVIDLQTKLNETQKKNSELEEKCKCTEARVAEITKKQLEKDKEYNELRKKLTEKLRQAQQEESRYLELAGQFEKELGNTRQELEMRTLQLDDVKKSAQEINSSRCIQLACAQEEVNRLKEELNKLLRKHCNLNAENERLHSQSAQLQSTVANMEEKSQLLTDQLEQYLMELQTVQTDKESLVQKNRELLSELRSLQNSYAISTKQQRELQFHHSSPKSQRTYVNNIPTCLRGAVSPPPMCQSPWSLGSQGTMSYHEDSPSQSPCMNEECDWYSTNFRNYSEDEEEENDWVNKVEDLAAQVRKTNKMWKNKLNGAECAVTKDTKK